MRRNSSLPSVSLPPANQPKLEAGEGSPQQRPRGISNSVNQWSGANTYIQYLHVGWSKITSVILEARHLPRYHGGTESHALRPFPSAPHRSSVRDSLKHSCERSGSKGMSETSGDDDLSDTEIHAKPSITRIPTNSGIGTSPHVQACKLHSDNLQTRRNKISSRKLT